MKGCVCIGLLGLLGWSHFCYGKEDVFNSQDTAWIINYDFSPVERDSFYYTLEIPVRPDTMSADFKYARVFWGNLLENGNANVSEVIDISRENRLSCGYAEGKYELVIKYYKSDPGTNLAAVADREVREIIFNQKLQGVILLEGSNSCLESHPDSLLIFLVRLSGYEDNPPGTVYTIQVRSDAPGKDMWRVDPPSELKGDTARVIFSGATGTFGADIRCKMTYKEDPKAVRYIDNSTDWKSVAVYQTPNLKEMFHFDNALKEDQTIEELTNMEVCTNQALTDINYDSLVNVKYMYANGLPIYSLRYDFEVEYFRKDSVNQKEWQNVTSDTTIVDTVNMIFKYPGFYKIRMVASNVCGVDSLHTDSVKGYDKKRYIQVFQGGEDVFECDKDTICGIDEAGVELTFMDFGKRYDWDPVPEYSFMITRSLNGVEDPDSVVLRDPPLMTLYKDGKTIVTEDAEGIGCDSTALKIKLYEPGTYTIVIRRTRFCDPPVEYTHRVAIGDVPTLPMDTLWQQLGATDISQEIRKCDTFVYQLPDVRIDSNNMGVDSIQWCFVKKSHLDTLYQVPGTDQSFQFDSLGDHKNYIRLRVHNYCGWSETAKAELYTDVRPQVTLWRDSVPDNDSLCVGLQYKYYWIGNLPTEYDIWGTWSEKILVNGGTVTGNVSALLASTEAGESKVGIIQSNIKYDKVYESFQIRNLKNFSCYQDVLDTLVILGRPSTIFYSDTIRHCEDFTSLDTKLLFETSTPEFRYIEWKFNEEPVERKTLPDYSKIFNLQSNDFDSLYVKTANSEGCYVEKKVVFEAQEKPEIEFVNKDQVICVEDTIFPEDYLNHYIQHTNVGTASGVYMKLYRDRTERANLLYDTTGNVAIKNELRLDHTSEDTVRLIYVAGNADVTENFGDCLFRDTITVKVWKPVLQIEGSDTLPDIRMLTYDFARSGTAVRIDTADIQGGITWQCIGGTGSFENEHDLKTRYRLSEQDKLKNYLEFELSGKTPCGVDLRDTLYVYLPKEELFAHTDTICVNDAGYTLWDPENGKTSGKYINPETLEWRLLEGKGHEVWGELKPGHTGAQVKFFPNLDAWKADTVKIEVKAWNIYDELKVGKVLTDTIFLKVNRFPVNVYPDTVYLEAFNPSKRIMPLANINVYKDGANSLGDAYCEDISWGMIRSEGIGAQFMSTSNGLGVNIGSPSGEENYVTELSLTLKGLKGCANVKDTLVALGVMPPLVKLSNFDICDGGNVRIDTGAHIKALDPLTSLTWEKDGNGNFDATFSFYYAGINDPIQEFTLKAIKDFTLFDGSTAHYKQQGKGTVHLYRKPVIVLYDRNGQPYTHDTLCLNDTEFHYERDWVDANFTVANYTPDQLNTSKSKGLSGSFPNFTLQEGVQEAQFIVTADLGGCKKWANEGDTIQIIRLKAMTGSFQVEDICAGGSFTVTNVVLDPMCASYSWMATGGTLNKTDPLKPVFTSTSAGAGSISLIVTPPHGCTPTATIQKSFLMKAPPSLVLSDTTICMGANLEIDFVRDAAIRSIQWKANGRIFATTTTETSVLYSYHAEDVVEGSIPIVAEITPELPCTDVVTSNIMKVNIQQPPVISGSLNGEVCQGDSLKLEADIVSAVGYKTVLWDLNGSAGALEEATRLDTRYIPGEISGTQHLKLTVTGLNGCADVSREVTIKVNESSVPAIRIPNIRCVGSAVTFEHVVTEPSGLAEGKWYINGEEKSSRWYSFAHTFDQAGKYEIRFTTVYNGICPRSVFDSVVINPLPQTDFTCDSIIGAGKEVDFINTTPGTVTHDWNFYGKGTKIKEEGGIYTHRYDLVDVASMFTDVTLTVTDANQCHAFKTKTLKVVGAPVAKFSKNFDPCTGEISFVNLSQGENMNFYWDLGNGYTSVDTVPENVVYTPVSKDSTYYISLTVNSKGGETVYFDTLKVISTIEPRFVVSPDKTGCEGKQLAKGFSNRTKGKANLYTFSWDDGSPDSPYSEFYAFPIYHKFSNPGTTLKKFTVTLTVSNECHTESCEEDVYIYPNVISTEFVPSDTRLCFGQEITFKNESFGYGADVEAWWLFESDLPAENNNAYEVLHRFERPGNYPVRLVMADRCNTDTSDMVEIRILGDLSLDFALAEGPYCHRQDIEMKVLSELKDRFTDFRWDFGDGNPKINVDSVQKRYNEPGVYQVRLSANSIAEGNCPVTTAGKEIEIHRTPFASIQPIEELSGCAPFTVDRFMRVGTGEESVFWDFKNGDTSVESVVTDVTFRQEGRYPVLLRLTSLEGCVDTTSKVVTVKRTPVVRFVVEDTLFCTVDGNVSIPLENQTPLSELASFEWSYNGREPFSRQEQPVSLRLQEEFGPIEIKLQATDLTTGCVKALTRKVVSGHQVRAEIAGDTTACLGTSIVLNNVSSFVDQVNWNLGDGSAEIGEALDYQYGEPGKYKLNVQMANEAGCRDSLQRWIVIYPLPVADFSFTEDYAVREGLPEDVDISKLPEVPSGGISFTNHSYVEAYDFAGEELYSWWDFGDYSARLVSTHPKHHYENNGEYPVTLFVKTEFGCVDSITEIVYIETVKGLFVPNAFAPGAGIEENPGVALFQPKGVGLLEYKIQVYDQWGTCVWSSVKLEDGRPAEGWDGTFNGQPLPKDVYHWKINAVFKDGTVWNGENGHNEGHVVLIR